jgi:tetratricopeptide (TPR) repeat protein
VLKGTTQIPPAELGAYMSTYWDLGWMLDDAGQKLALSLGSEAFDGDPATRALVRAQLYWWRGDTALARAWGDSAARGLGAQARATPGDAQRHSVSGLALAYAGHYNEAIAEAKRGLELGPVSTDAQFAPYYVHQLVRVYLLAGRKDDALDELEALMKMPYFVTPAWLRIDPTFAPLRGNPRFERLTKSAS